MSTTKAHFNNSVTALITNIPAKEQSYRIVIQPAHQGPGKQSSYILYVHRRTIIDTPNLMHAMTPRSPHSITYTASKGVGVVTWSPPLHDILAARIHCSQTITSFTNQHTASKVKC